MGAGDTGWLHDGQGPGEGDSLCRYCRGVRDTLDSLLAAARVARAAAGEGGTPEFWRGIVAQAQIVAQRGAMRLCERAAAFGIGLRATQWDWFAGALMGRGYMQAGMGPEGIGSLRDAWEPGRVRAVARDAAPAALEHRLRSELHGVGRVRVEGQKMTLRPHHKLWETRRGAPGRPQVVRRGWLPERGAAWVTEVLSAVAWIARRGDNPGIAFADCAVALPDALPFRIEPGAEAVPESEILRDFGRLCPEIIGCRPRRGGAIEMTLSGPAAAALREDLARWDAADGLPAFPALRREGEEMEAEPAAGEPDR